MTTEEHISSGNLELFVAGALPNQEMEKVAALVAKDERLELEVEVIEDTLKSLGEAASPGISTSTTTQVLHASLAESRHKSGTGMNWGAISGWAAAVLAIGGIFWLMNQNAALKEEIELTNTENSEIKTEIELANEQIAAQGELLEVLGSKDYNTILLPGNEAVDANAYAKVFYNSTERIAYIDTRGLPQAPGDNVYQAWSLKLDPLTPSSMGIMSEENEVEDGIYKFENVPDPEAFGITLEPAGGSEAPTLSQLYTLGTVSP